MLKCQKVRNILPIQCHATLGFPVNHIVPISETWLRSADSDEVVVGDLVLTGYVFHHIPREMRGSGVGIMLKRMMQKYITLELVTLLLKPLEFT